MARIMSRQLREELAEELGISHLVQGDYWGDVPSRQCGNLVRQAILRAQRHMVEMPPTPTAPVHGGSTPGWQQAGSAPGFRPPF